MKTLIQLCVVMTMLTLIFGGCAKEATLIPDTSQTGTGGPPIQFQTPMEGLMAAMHVKLTYNGVPQEYSQAVAWFGHYDGVTMPSPFKNAGDVSCNTVDITEATTGYYTKNDASGSSLGLPDNSVDWDVTGNSGNSIPAISYTDSKTFPAAAGISNTQTTTLMSQPFALTAQNAVAADIVMFILYTQGGKYAVITKTANATTGTFSAADISYVTGGAGGLMGIQIMTVNISYDTFGGKKYAFTKQNSTIKYVTVTP